MSIEFLSENSAPGPRMVERDRSEDSVVCSRNGDGTVLFRRLPPRWAYEVAFPGGVGGSSSAGESGRPSTSFLGPCDWVGHGARLAPGANAQVETRSAKCTLPKTRAEGVRVLYRPLILIGRITTVKEPPQIAASTDFTRKERQRWLCATRGSAAVGSRSCFGGRTAAFAPFTCN